MNPYEYLTSKGIEKEAIVRFTFQELEFLLQDYKKSLFESFKNGFNSPLVDTWDNESDEVFNKAH